MKTKLRNSIYGLLPIAVTLVYFGLCQMRKRLIHDQTELSGRNTAEGTDALLLSLPAFRIQGLV